MAFRAVRDWLLLLMLLIASPVRAEEPAAAPQGADGVAATKDSATKFIRVVRNDAGSPQALETAIVRYEPVEGGRPLVVDLIGAVHVGDKSYYDQLNKVFLNYDSLLYELVAPEGARPPKQGERRSESAVSVLQSGMKSLLDLEFQLDQIDYSPKNFVHADMSPEEFSKSMQQRGESFWKILLRALANAPVPKAGTPPPPSDAELLAALFAKDRSMRLKRIFAQQFENLDIMVAVFEGPNGSTLITQRNIKALEVLKREIKQGKRRIGIFYGAGHLADMEKRLLADFGLRRSGQKWLSAWSLTDKKPKHEKPELPDAPDLPDAKE